LQPAEQGAFSMTDALPFIDLAAQRRCIGGAMDEAILRVVHHGGYIMGPEVTRLEADLSAFCGAAHVVSCANGTDALALILMAKGLRPGEAVLCPSFTFAATAEVITWFGATPVFVDVREDTFNLDPASLEEGIRTARGLGLKPAGVISVDLFGQPADYDAIEPVCTREGLWLLSDAAQSFGATYKGRKVGTIGFATATSFFPAKPLGCYGDGGAVFTNDAHLAEVLRSLRIHGQGENKYDNQRIGMNGRLDTMQAAVLIEKLKIFSDEIAARDRIARRYNDLLGEVAIVPEVLADATRCGRNTRCGFLASTARRSKPTSRQQASQQPFIIRSPCIGRQPTRIFRSPETGCPRPSGSPPRSSACRCTPI
jgi:dTDP-4-amino-4,6-dideoxygalactose transaminase